MPDKSPEVTLARLTTIIEHSDDAILSKTADGLILSWNPSAERIFGYTAAEILGKQASILIPSDHPDEEEQIWERIRRGEIIQHHETVRLRKDGSRLDVSLTIFPIKNASGQFIGASTVARDITERKRNEERAQQFTAELEHRVAERTAQLETLNQSLQEEMADRQRAQDELRVSEERFSNAFEFAAIGMALVSLEGRWLKVNESLCQLTGYSAEELATKTFQDITHPDDLEIDLENVHQLLTGKVRSYRMEKRYFRKDGNLVWVLLGVSLVRNEQNEPLYFISQIEDITRMKEAMVRQQELAQKAMAAERAKSEFLAIMSHEIRTPMNGVIGMTSVLADTDLTETQRDYVNTIVSSGEALLNVINDILDFSKLEFGKMKIESRPFHLQDCLKESLNLFISQFQARNLRASYHIHPGVPPDLMGDAMRLRQILGNLISNAVKFTAQGEVIIRVQRSPGGERENLFLFSVTDTGVGIAAGGMDKLFKSFQQVDTSTTRRYGGTGLGLAISKRLAELMGGTMWAESTEGSGSTFFFTSPLRQSDIPEPEEHPGDTVWLKDFSLLLVDNDTARGATLDREIKRWGRANTLLCSGAEAVSQWSAKKFDVIVIDDQVPEMKGLALAREIHRATDTPMILLSGSGQVVVGEEANLFKFQLAKPARPLFLFNLLRQMIGVAAKPLPVVAKKQFDSEMAKKNPLRILLAEDNLVNQKVGLKMLSQLGYGADLAGNGLQAVKAASKCGYDLIFMDIQMPEMDGIKAAHTIREELGDRSPFLAALTAEALQGDRERFLELGFDAYLSKPLQANALQELLKTVRPLSVASRK
jgi:PAS domain S-box-containing protein